MTPRRLFLSEYQAGATPRSILEKYGYSAEILGEKRIWGIAATIKKQQKSSAGLHEGTRPKKNRAPGDTKNKSPEELLRDLQGEISILRQEIQFLKRLRAIGHFRR